MNIFEYDYEMHMKVLKEESWEDGYVVGFIEGFIEGFMEARNRMLLLIQHMQDNNELHLLDKLDDKTFLQQMYDKYSL